MWLLKGVLDTGSSSYDKNFANAATFAKINL